MPTLIAQCVMCYRTAAAQQGGRSEILNSGILIMLGAPLLVLISLAVLVWRREVKRRGASREGL
ncbi:MAG: hypothetical protein JWN34_5886 [Bryobacterales bacterium]|jgi:hypothetical protein|nr:hypothetical protein [Bryobacterales bacterium]